MEYSKEDLMEAKKQILGVGENMGTEESKKIWEENAQFWDNAMGDESNEFHREVVRPKVCVMLNKTTAKLFKQGKLTALPASTRNKLYVAITRAHGTVYLIDE